MAGHQTSSNIFKYQNEIQSMMFTFGEVRHTLPSTLQLVERILHTQAIEWIIQASEIASLRGGRAIHPEDLLFLLRHDTSKLSRLKEFLSWKEVRKKAKTEPSDPFDAGAEEEVDEKEPPKKKLPRYSWEFPNCLLDVCDSDESEDDEDREEYLQEVRDRLEEADKITRKMTKEEYIEFAECRQASFTYKKCKKFRDWIGFKEKFKPSDEITEIFGFLIWECLRTLTLKALKVKQEYKESKKIEGRNEEGHNKLDAGLFGKKSELSPLQSGHIQEAYNQLQMSNKSCPLKLFTTGLVRAPIQLI